MSRKRINPQTHGTLRVQVTDATGTVVTTATASAVIYAPTGQKLAVGVTVSNAGGGFYDLTVLPEWSTDTTGNPIEGEFRALIAVNNSGVKLARRVKYLVAFEAD